MIGELSEKVLEALLETVPFEFSVLDENDKALAWNKHETRIFKRPTGVIGRDVRNCHPKKSLDKVERILREMKEGSRDKARFWIDLSIDPESRRFWSHIRSFLPPPPAPLAVSPPLSDIGSPLLPRSF